MRWVVRILVAVVALVISVELFFQLASRLVSDRASAAGAAHAVLCVGDSHTFGSSVPVEESYPYQLQVALNREAPGRFSVVNLGIPGYNTAMVANRLATHIARFEPEVIIVWVGVNNAWNWTEEPMAGEGWLRRLDALLMNSRVYRLARVRLHDREIDQSIQEDTTDNIFEQKPTSSERFEDGFAVGVEGRIERAEYDRREQVLDEGTAARTERDFRVMAELARSNGVRIVFVTYPLGFKLFRIPNQAIESVAQEFGVTVVSARAAMERIPKEERQWTTGAHPDGRLYGEVARDLAQAILAPADRPPVLAGESPAAHTTAETSTTSRRP